MSQSKVASFAEAILDTLLGLAIGVAAQRVVLGWFGIELPLAENVEIALCLTVTSFLRRYLTRRLFNYYTD